MPRRPMSRRTATSARWLFSFEEIAMSLSRQFAAFIANLRYDDLPPAVVDRAKGVTLQALTSALVGRDMAASRQALALMRAEGGGGGGAGTGLFKRGGVVK